MGSDLTRTQHRSRAGNPTCHSHASEQQGKETKGGKLIQKIFGICKGYKNCVLLPFHRASNTSWIPLMVGRALPDPGVTPAGKPGNCRNFLARKTAAGEGTAGARGCNSQWLFVLFSKLNHHRTVPSSLISAIHLTFRVVFLPKYSSAVPRGFVRQQNPRAARSSQKTLTQISSGTTLQAEFPLQIPEAN